jgi:phage protein D
VLSRQPKKRRHAAEYREGLKPDRAEHPFQYLGLARISPSRKSRYSRVTTVSTIVSEMAAGHVLRLLRREAGRLKSLGHL